MVEGLELDPKIVSLTATDESVVFAATPRYVTVGAGSHWMMPALVLTNRRLVISKERLFKRRLDFAVGWADVGRVDGGLWKGGGPSIQLLVCDPLGSQILELIVDPQYAVDVESAIRSGYMGIQD